MWHDVQGWNRDLAGEVSVTNRGKPTAQLVKKVSCVAINAILSSVRGPTCGEAHFCHGPWRQRSTLLRVLCPRFYFP